MTDVHDAHPIFRQIEVYGMRKRHRGNMLIVVAVFAGLVLVLSGMFTLILSQQRNAQQKAEESGVLDSYIAIANLCADGFKYQLEGKGAQFNPSVDNPTAEYGDEVFESALQMIQADLSDGAASEDGSWSWKIKNPKTIMEYSAVIDNDSAAALADELLDKATLEVGISQDMTEEISGRRYSGIHAIDIAEIDPIYFTVTLEKGTVKIVQQYRLAGELMTRNHDTDSDGNIVHVNIKINGSNSTCTLIEQKATRANILTVG